MSMEQKVQEEYVEKLEAEITQQKIIIQQLKDLVKSLEGRLNSEISKVGL